MLFLRLYVFLELGEEEEEEPAPAGPAQPQPKGADKGPKKMFKVSHAEGSCKITISAHTPDTGDRKRRKEKDFASPSSESKIHVNSGSPLPLPDGESFDKCAVNIQFDMNTKKLWQDLHYPYGNYTSFFRHLILLEKYWRSGDLTLAPTASLKSASYLKSVKNRITAYEGKQSDADLSANTRPDLEEPAAPTLTHTPGEAVLANLPTDLPSPKLEPFKESTILRIPRIPQSLVSPNSILSPESLELTRANSLSPTPKIRVRQDLMQHLGLIAKSSANIVEKRSKPSSVYTTSNNQSLNFQLSAQQHSHINPALLQHGTPNLSKLLSDPNSTYSVEDKTTVKSGIKSSNSQLFKSTESSGAIPLTFNNSIAEVLAAASKAKLNKSREPSPKPEITITPKMSKTTDKQDGLIKLGKKSGTPTASPGGLSILKRTITSSGATVNPISNMAKLLQTQSPGLPPHIIAQQSLPARASPKVMSRPPITASSNFRPVQLSSGKPSGIQTVNKKSLTTVLDRLSCFTTSSPTKPNPTLSSSLVQQLQAPLVSSRPSANSKPSKQNKESSLRAQIQKALGPTAPQFMSQLSNTNQYSPSSSNSNQFTTSHGVQYSPSTTLSTTLTSALPGSVIVPSSLSGIQISQPILQFPGGTIDPTSLMFPNLMGNQSIAAQNAAQNAAFNMMASMSGMSPQQAMELLNQQQQLMNQQQQQQLINQQQNRIRAPPPLKKHGKEA